jgi:serine/threonine-protein kinase HipA
MTSVPVWVWLPGSDSPTHAADLLSERTPRLVYSLDYLARDDALPLDPVELRLVRNARGSVITAADGLPE